MAQMLSLGSQSNLIFWSLHCCWATYKQSYAVIPFVTQSHSRCRLPTVFTGSFCGLHDDHCRGIVNASETALGLTSRFRPGECVTRFFFFFFNLQTTYLPVTPLLLIPLRAVKILMRFMTFVNRRHPHQHVLHFVFCAN